MGAREKACVSVYSGLKENTMKKFMENLATLLLTIMVAIAFAGCICPSHEKTEWKICRKVGGTPTLTGYMEENMTVSFSAFIENLNARNNGKLIGEWVNFPATEEEIDDILNLIGCTDETGRLVNEYFVSDYDDDTGLDLFLMLGEHASLEDVNELAEKLEEMEECDWDTLRYVIEAFGHKEAYEVLINNELDEYYVLPLEGSYADDDALVGRALLDSGLLWFDVPEGLERYLDESAIGRDFMMDTVGSIISDTENCRYLYVYRW